MDVIICNTRYDSILDDGLQWVKVDKMLESDSRLYRSDLSDYQKPEHHDAVRLAQVLMDLYNERTGPILKE